MNDVVLAALFSSAGAALVAVAGAIASIFGPAWREQVRARIDAESHASAQREIRALELFERLGALTMSNANYADRRAAHAALNAFTATLRQGEGLVARFAWDLLATTDGKGKDGLEQVTAGAAVVFAYLRGDTRIEDFIGTPSA